MSELKRGDELERKLRYLASEINAEGITVPLEFELPQAPNSTITDLDIDVRNTPPPYEPLNRGATKNIILSLL